MKDIVERFINYTKIDTTSNDESGITPSSQEQFILANILKDELIELNLKDVEVSDNCFVYGTLASNTDKKCDVIGLSAHLDTSNATSGKNIKARVIKNYDGKDIKLSDNIYSTVKDYPFLADLKGDDIIVTDGTTLLGGDDKAGIAIIMDTLRCLNENNIKHGEIRVCFSPDEEIGEGIHHVDLNKFKCDYAYTLDGGLPNVLYYENFNAAHADITFNGVSIHPGSAKDKMINAIQLAMDFHSQLDEKARPEKTEKREGFNHILELSGTCQSAKDSYIIRNHDINLLHQQMQDFRDIAARMNQQYGREVVTLEIGEDYHNMKDCFKDKMYIVEKAAQAIASEGLTVEYDAMRGGTDGAILSYMGLPTPNLGTGAYNCHGNHELVDINHMEKLVKIVTKIVESE